MVGDTAVTVVTVVIFSGEETRHERGAAFAVAAQLRLICFFRSPLCDVFCVMNASVTAFNDRRRRVTEDFYLEHVPYGS